MAKHINLYETKARLRQYLTRNCSGKMKAQTQNQIADALGVPDPRLIRRLCRELDMKDFRVIKCNNGMYHPNYKEEEEEQHYAMTLISQAEQMLKRAKHHIPKDVFTRRYWALQRNVIGYDVAKLHRQQREMF